MRSANHTFEVAKPRASDCDSIVEQALVWLLSSEDKPPSEGSVVQRGSYLPEHLEEFVCGRPKAGIRLFHDLDERAEEVNVLPFLHEQNL